MNGENINNTNYREVEKIMANDKDINMWLQFICKNEPSFYIMAENITSKMLSEMSNKIQLDMKNTPIIANALLKTFICSYAMQYNREVNKTQKG